MDLHRHQGRQVYPQLFAAGKTLLHRSKWVIEPPAFVAVQLDCAARFAVLSGVPDCSSVLVQSPAAK